MTSLNTVILNNIKTLQENVAKAASNVNKRLEDIHIMAVTKTVSPYVVNMALEHGIVLLGENRAQEYLQKQKEYHINFENIHFIGHLQTNKVKYIIDKVGMIQSVGSINLAREINRQAMNLGKCMDILLEVNIGNEVLKSGFSESETVEMVQLLSNHENIRIRGLMCIPPKENVETYFSKMNGLYCTIKSQNIQRVTMEYLSMGMSNDYEQAIHNHANMIRVGSALFGEKNIGG